MTDKFKSTFIDANGTPVEDVGDTSGKGFPHTEAEEAAAAKTLGIDNDTLDQIRQAKSLINDLGGDFAGEYDLTNAQVAAVLALAVKGVVQRMLTAGDETTVEGIRNAIKKAGIDAGYELFLTCKKLVEG